MLSPSRLVRAAALTAMGAVALVLPLTPPGANAAVVSTVPPLTFLHVVTPPGGPDLTPYLADAAGRQVLLHGVAAVGMEDVAYPEANGGPAVFPVSPAAYAGRCPKASPLIPQPALCESEAAKPAYQQSIAPASGDDFAQMRALGFNAVRLVLNWSQLEPHPGVYSATYLDRVAQVVDWARQQGIYLILDMHQDQYSRYIVPVDKASAPSGCSPSGGGDGAPGWAVQSDGKPGCALYGVDELNPAESAAFANFWQNSPVDAPQGRAPGPGLQDHYIGALAALANRFENDPTVLGYELMNEPQPGSLGSLPAANGYQASSQELYPFYTRAVEALTGVRDGLPTCPASAPTRCRTPAPIRSWPRSAASRSSSSRSPTGTCWTSRCRSASPSRSIRTSCSRLTSTRMPSPLSRICSGSRPNRVATRRTSNSGTRQPRPRRKRCTLRCS